MGNLFLVRHAQASFGAENYDQLSDLGLRQSIRLGQYWRAKGLVFNAVITGTLLRHAQTWAGIAQGAGFSLQAEIVSGLDEYDSQAVIQAVHPEPLPTPDTPELYRQHFRLLRQGLNEWMLGRLHPHKMATWQEFLSGITQVLDWIRESQQGNVLVISSGGPISSAIGHVLGAPTESIVELNLRIRNSSVSELIFSPKRYSLLSYNTLPHLDSTEHKGWVTYA